MTARLVRPLVRCSAQAGTDAKRLEQIVANLLENAVGFTGDGGKVEVLVARLGGDAEVRVRDTGRGLDAEALAHVFDRFWQREPALTRAHGGLGLGLTLVRHLVEEHGGAVCVESAGEGQGATFTVRLPLAST